MIAVELIVDGKSVERTQYSVHPPDDSRFAWRDYAFDLLDHEYDRSMKLRVRRFELEPITGATVP